MGVLSSCGTFLKLLYWSKKLSSGGTFLKLSGFEEQQLPLNWNFPQIPLNSNFDSKPIYKKSHKSTFFWSGGGGFGKKERSKPTKESLQWVVFYAPFVFFSLGFLKTHHPILSGDQFGGFAEFLQAPGRAALALSSRTGEETTFFFGLLLVIQRPHHFLGGVSVGWYWLLWVGDQFCWRKEDSFL